MDNTDLATIRQILPLLIPVLIIQLILVAVALNDLIKQPATRGPKWMWALIILFIQMIGPILYLVLGRREE